MGPAPNARQAAAAAAWRPDRARFGVDARTFGDRHGLVDIVAALDRHDIRHTSLWGYNYADMGVAAARRLLADHGVSVRSFAHIVDLTLPQGPARREALETARRLIDDAAAFGAHSVGVSGGGLRDRSLGLAATRGLLADGLAELLPHARSAGVKLSMEPIHPMLAAAGCVHTLRDAAAIVRPLGPGVGLKYDTFHTWWDPDVYAATEEVGDLIIDVQISDWMPDAAYIRQDRGMMGEGVIDFRGLLSAIDAAGYDGLFEAEVSSAQRWWLRPADDIAQAALEGYLQC